MASSTCKPRTNSQTCTIIPRSRLVCHSSSFAAYGGQSSPSTFGSRCSQPCVLVKYTDILYSIFSFSETSHSPVCNFSGPPKLSEWHLVHHEQRRRRKNRRKSKTVGANSDVFSTTSKEGEERIEERVKP